MAIKKGTAAGIAALLGLGLAGAAAYFLTRPKPTEQACTSQPMADGTTKFTCVFPGRHTQPVTIDLGGLREIISITGSTVLSGDGVNTGRSYPYSELHIRGSSVTTPPREEIVCQNSPPGTLCQISLVPISFAPNWQARLLQVWGLSRTAPITAPGSASVVEESVIADVRIEVIVR